MFNVGGGEFMLIALIALLVLGPDKLPDFARKSARVLGQLRSMSQGFQDEMRGVMNLDDTDTPETSLGPRLVGPIGTPTTADNDGASDPATGEPASPGTGPTGSADQPAPAAGSDLPASSAGSDRGDEGTTSGTSAA